MAAGAPPEMGTTATSGNAHARMTGDGWPACSQHCTPEGTFAHEEGEMFAEIRTREA